MKNLPPPNRLSISRHPNGYWKVYWCDKFGVEKTMDFHTPLVFMGHVHEWIHLLPLVDKPTQAVYESMLRALSLNRSDVTEHFFKQNLQGQPLPDNFVFLLNFTPYETPYLNSKIWDVLFGQFASYLNGLTNHDPHMGVAIYFKEEHFQIWKATHFPLETIKPEMLSDFSRALMASVLTGSRHENAFMKLIPKRNPFLDYLLDNLIKPSSSPRLIHHFLKIFPAKKDKIISHCLLNIPQFFIEHLPAQEKRQLLNSPVLAQWINKLPLATVADPSQLHGVLQRMHHLFMSPALSESGLISVFSHLQYVATKWEVTHKSTTASPRWPGWGEACRQIANRALASNYHDAIRGLIQALQEPGLFKEQPQLLARLEQNNLLQASHSSPPDLPPARPKVL